MGSVVLVVGAAGGIGSALCRRLASKAATLVLAGRDEAKLRQLQEEVGGEVLGLDARDFTAVAAAATAVAERHGALDGAVNLAGSILLKPAHATSSEEFEETLATNLRTAFALVRGVAPVMGRMKGGSIVLMSSAAARVGLANHEALAAAKAGVAGLALSAAATYAPRKVRINVVSPGLVRTPLAARLIATDAALKVSESMHALGRIGEPEDVAGMIDWLLDPAQGFITGQVFGVDGGLGTLRPR